ncbi:MAG: hypothetical protein IPH74_15680 [Bacteroidetes bacterium]|nr:hypothetical protein [Bacteroidota bacterium]
MKCCWRFLHAINPIDLEACKNVDIVFNSPYSNTRSVVELIIAKCYYTKRRIPERTKCAIMKVFG